MSEGRRYCGRLFSASEIERIREWIAETPSLNRYQLSLRVCDELRWQRPDGRPKDMSCRVAMLRMERDGLIVLPPPLKTKTRRAAARRTAEAEPELLEVTVSAGALRHLHLEAIEECNRKISGLWNEYIDRYHYLGYQPLPGAQIRYFVRAEGQILGCLGFGAAAWKTLPRDRFIGWTRAQREDRLHLIVNNARFLILPWVRSRNLASRVLGMARRQVATDWANRYSYRPVLLETFVEVPRFRGTCYQAANWQYLGETQGRGKLDVNHTACLPKKAVWVQPLTRNFRKILCT